MSATTSTITARFPQIKAHLNWLYSLAYDPNTIDSERYARKTRALVKACANVMLTLETSTEVTQIHTLFTGLHRKLDWEAPVTTNAELIDSTLRAAEILSAQRD